jgi:hypothetical protein
MGRLAPVPGSYGPGTRVKHRISPCSSGSGGPKGRESATVNRLEDLRCGSAAMSRSTGRPLPRSCPAERSSPGTRSPRRRRDEPGSHVNAPAGRPAHPMTQDQCANPLASRLVAAGQRDAPPLTAETWPNSGLTHPADPFGLLADDGEHSRVARDGTGNSIGTARSSPRCDRRGRCPARA